MLWLLHADEGCASPTSEAPAGAPGGDSALGVLSSFKPGTSSEPILRLVVASATDLAPVGYCGLGPGS